MNRDFARTGPNRLWLTDITEHRTREGKVYCAVVLDAFSRRVVGWSIDSSQTAQDTRLEDIRRGPERAPTLAPTSRCCDDRLSPGCDPRSE